MGLMTGNAPDDDAVPDALYDLFIEDLPVVVPGFVGPFRVVLLALSNGEDEWQLHYAATGDTEGGLSIEAQDDAGNSYDALTGFFSSGDADLIVGRWNLTPLTAVEPALLHLALFFDESLQPESWDEDVDDKRARTRARIDILQAQLLASADRQVIAELMYSSDERATAIARLMEDLDLSELQAHYVADLPLGRMTGQSRQLIEEELRRYQTELRELGD